MNERANQVRWTQQHLDLQSRNVELDIACNYHLIEEMQPSLTERSEDHRDCALRRIAESELRIAGANRTLAAIALCQELLIQEAKRLEDLHER